MIQQLLKIGSGEIEEFPFSKKAIDVNNVDIKNILVSDEIAYLKNKETDAKYFVGHKTNKKNAQFFITFPEMSRYFKNRKRTNAFFF